MFLTDSGHLLVDGLLALIYPQSCAVCQGSVESLRLGNACADCWAGTRTLSLKDTICWKCGALSKGIIAADKKETVRCRRCDGHSFTAARACGFYEGALRAAVLALKHEPTISSRLAELLIQTKAQPALETATRVIPVPLHPRRQESRGFNQAEAIARVVARGTNLPLDVVSLVRTTHAEVHRAGLDARGRRETVADAFSVSYPRLIAGERILLVDDVFTTGATVSACANALRAAGAEQVYVLTIARPFDH